MNAHSLLTCMRDATRCIKSLRRRLATGRLTKKEIKAGYTRDTLQHELAEELDWRKVCGKKLRETLIERKRKSHTSRNK